MVVHQITGKYQRRYKLVWGIITSTMTGWKKKIIFNISWGELMSWLLFVLFWGTFFYFVLDISFNPPDKTYYLKINLIDNGVKLLLTLPLWWLYFHLLADRSLKLKLLLHLVTFPLFCITWLLTYGAILNSIWHHAFDYSTAMYDIYSTAFFYCMQFAIFHAYHFWLHTKRQFIREQELKELAFKSEIKALKAQIEPHFLFNTLNSISASVPPSLEKTRVLIAQLADTFRYALKVSERQYVTLEQELEFIQTWLALEKHRFGSRLDIQYSIDDSVLDTLVPPMVLQPLVENALNHGISPLIKGGTVTIECKNENGYVRITVKDTGVGYEGNLSELQNRGIGLKNTTQRIERLYNEKLVIARNKQGLRFSFRIPPSYTKGAGEITEL